MEARICWGEGGGGPGLSVCPMQMGSGSQITLRYSTAGRLQFTERYSFSLGILK